uniref:Uncharacterized protein n=1 Tax=Arundo donax TaxID=35708 RepID=A0A0A8YXR5_ARUDO
MLGWEFSDAWENRARAEQGDFDGALPAARTVAAGAKGLGGVFAAAAAAGGKGLVGVFPAATGPKGCLVGVFAAAVSITRDWRSTRGRIGL